MIDPIVFFTACVFGIPVCNLLHHSIRPHAWAIFGFVFLLFLAPGSAAFLIFVVLQSLIFTFVFLRHQRSHALRKYGPYMLLLNLLWVDFNQLILGFYADTIGASFAIIRIFMATKHLLVNRNLNTADIVPTNLVAAFYMPTLLVGPVFSAVEFRKQNEKVIESTSHIYRYLIIGLSLAVVFTQLFVYFSERVAEITAFYFVEAIFLFLALFSSFWGLSLIAEMTAKCSGYNLPKNFNKPWLAIGIRDFWQRWHISMSQFIMQFIYFPLTLKGVNPKIATIAAFVFMGLWHEVEIGYLLWGVAHGALMSFWPNVENPTRLRKNCERVLTIFCVINLSYVANYAFK